MADTPLSAVPDPDDDVDPDDLAFVERLLARQDYLRPDDAPRGAPSAPADGAGGPMPDEVWQRLAAALEAQSTIPVSGAGRARASRPARWAGGLVAAGVAVVAVGIGVTVLGTGGGTAVVAGSALDEGAARTAKVASASAFAADEIAPAAASGESGSQDFVAGSGAADATVVPAVAPAARMVLDSRTDYQPARLQGQVVSLVKQAGFTTLRDATTKQMPTPAMPVEDGFTGSWSELRDCVTWLTNSAESQALVVDRGTYVGQDAGVVVAPAVLSEPVPGSPVPSGGAVGGETSSASPAPTATVATPVGSFDVWVVDPNCTKVAATLDDFDLYAWQP